MRTKKFIEDIRTFEADHALKPSDIQVSATGEITVTIDKSVLYQYEPNRKSMLQSFWSWLNDSDNSFNPADHADKIAEQVNQNMDDDFQVRVSARKRYKQLPIPYFSIPIPVENAGTKVRDYDNLAVQKIKVSLTFPENSNSQEAIKKLAKAAVMSDTLEGAPQLPDAARRVSWNPIKWVLHGVSKCIPRSWVQKAYQVLPDALTNKWIKATRPYEWGTKFSKWEVNHGFINSGLAASLLNIAAMSTLTAIGSSSPGALLGSAASLSSLAVMPKLTVVGLSSSLGNVCTTLSGYSHRPEEPRLNDISTSRSGFFAQTRAKLAPRSVGRDHENMPTTEQVVNRAIERTFNP